VSATTGGPRTARPDDAGEETVRGGHYAEKQLFSRSWLISWTHRSRFDLALELGRRFAGKRILDFGCGDGTFLGLLDADPAHPALGVGAEIDQRLVDDCLSRFGGRERLRFMLTRDLDAPEHAAAYDAIFCMEVLEHVVDLDHELDRLTRMVRPGGTLVVSVPVETGLPLLVKQSARTVLGWRGVGDYPGQTSYRWGELARGLLAGRRQHITRPVLGGGDGEPFHDHKGFNWMALRDRIARRLTVQSTVGSPLRWLPPHLASQVWFIARKAA